MQVSLPRTLLVMMTALAVPSFGHAAELPDTFPSDVPVADYMSVVSVTRFDDDLKVSLEAEGQTLAGVAEWFQSGLTAAGWSVEGEQVSERNAILAYKKGSRRCGIMVTNFVLNESMQMDTSKKGISIQVSAADQTEDAATTDSAAEATMESTGDAAD